MNLERITTSKHPMYQRALALYQISFPSHEQRERTSQDAVLKNSAYHFDLIFDNDNFVGEILYWEIAGMRYVEHFCILPEMRNKHYGQRTLGLLQDKPLILEIDPPVDEIAIRRKHFYERCGFTENPYCHVHPPYHAGNQGHALVVMSSPEGLTQAEYDIFFSYLKNTVMKNVF